MDPAQRPRERRLSRLPRARGDGPSRPAPRPEHPPASPRSRGWTRLAGRREGGGGGFPALAGMDPSCSTRVARSSRLPRARGDGPDSTVLCHIHTRASPRSRGWTLAPRPPPDPRAGFPALAGMDPSATTSVVRLRGLPRARGDGPGSLGGGGGADGASPRSRGWTPLRCRHPSLRGGFPALAGMDPPYFMAMKPQERLPRARGDGPSPLADAAGPTRASPRSRGWTAVSYRVTAAAYGFPALAGMDPARRLWAPCAAGLPRARGDGPASTLETITPSLASPRSRGWTRCNDGCTGYQGGFPALAGMDPRAPSSPPGQPGLPRARGDGPGSLGGAATRMVASPRSRGWTRGVVPLDRRRVGFPALAGMDPPDHTA